MHDLIPLGPALPGALTAAEIDATMAYAEAEKAQATRAAYASDWRDFAVWCLTRGATALPAHQGIVAAYLSSLADQGRKASTIGRRAAAIGYHHKMAGHEPPTGSEAVKAVLRGIRRTIGAAKQGTVPATSDLIAQMLALCPASMIDRRDRALNKPAARVVIYTFGCDLAHTASIQSSSYCRHRQSVRGMKCTRDANFCHCPVHCC